MSARKSRIVHMFAFIALVANLFAPVLTLPVSAEDILPDPVVTTNEQSGAQAPADTDLDGVTDDLDQCIDVAAVVDANGDGCEDAPVPVDTDLDGVTDDLDQCIDVAAVVDANADGCEDAPAPVDSDGDGVTDDLDQCIDVAAVVDANGDGCEDAPVPVDSDGDGVTDDLDQCIDVAAVMDANGDGCEDAPVPVDSDGDGVTDEVDVCADVAPTSDTNGDGCEDLVVDEPVVAPVSVLPVVPTVEGCGDLVITTDPTAGTGITYTVVSNGDGSFVVQATIDPATHVWGEVAEPWRVVDGVAVYPVDASPCPPSEPVVPDTTDGTDDSGEKPDDEKKSDDESSKDDEEKKPDDGAITVQGRTGPIQQSQSKGLMTTQTTPDRPLSVAKIASPAGEVTPGSTIVYSIQVTNSGPTFIGGFTFKDVLPAGVTYLSYSTPYPSDSCVYTSGSHSVQCQTGLEGTVVGNSTETWKITVRVNQSPGNVCELTNSVVGNWASNNSASVSNSLPCVDVVVSKTSNSSVLIPNGQVTWVLTASNQGGGTATNVIIVDQLPVILGVTWDYPPNCTAGAVQNGKLPITCAVGSLGAGLTSTVSITSRASAIPECGPITNTAGVSASNEPTSRKGNNTASLTVTIPCDNDKQVSYCHDNNAADGHYNPQTTSVSGWYNGHYSQHDGTGPAGLDDIWPQVTYNNVTYPSHGNQLWLPDCKMPVPDLPELVPAQCEDGDYTAPSIEIPDGAGKSEFTFAESWSADGLTVTVTATLIDADRYDVPNPLPATWGDWQRKNDNSVKFTHTFDGKACLSIEKNVVGNSTVIEPGAPVQFTIVVTNTGSTAATGVTVTDTLPAGLATLNWTAVSTSGSCGDPVVVAGVITCTGITVPAKSGNTNGTATITLEAGITATAPVCGTYTNTASWELQPVPQISANTADTGKSGHQNPPGPVTSGSTTADVTIACNPTFTLVKSVNNPTVKAGDTLTFQFVLTNTGNTLWTGQLTDSLPSMDGQNWDVTLVPSAAATLGCASPLQTSSLIDCSFQNLVPGESITVTASITLPDSIAVDSEMCGEHENTAFGKSLTPLRVKGVGTYEPILDAVVAQSGSNEVSTFVECPGIDVEKSDGLNGGSVLPGDEFTYTITVTNTGNVPLSGYAMEDTLPPGVTVGAITPAEDCTYSDGLHEVTCAVPELAANGGTFVATITVSVPTDITAAMCEGLTNSVLVDRPHVVGIANGIPPAPPSDSDSITTPVNCEEGFSFDKSALDNVWEVGPGGTLGYVITLTNTGNVDITSATISDTLDVLPEGTWTIVESAGVDCTLAGDNVSLSCELTGNLVPTASVSVTLTAQVPETLTLTDNGNAWCGSWENTATVEGAYSTTARPVQQVGINLNPNQGGFGESASEWLFVNCTGLYIEKSDGLNGVPVQPGENFTYTITVTNMGNVWLQDIVVEDLIDTRLENVSATVQFGMGDPEACTFDDVTRIVTCDIELLPDGESATIRITANVIATPTVEQCDKQMSNVANITSYSDAVPTLLTTNREITIPQEGDIPSNPVITTIDCQPDLDLEKTGPAESVQPGEDIVFTLTATNIGTYPAFDKSITDSLPEGLDALDWNFTFSPDDTGASCEQTGSTILCEGIDLPAYDGELIITLTAGTTATSPVCNDYTNQAGYTDGARDGQRFADVTIECVPNYEVEKTSNLTSDADANSVISAGDTITYTISVTNTGNQEISGIDLTDTFSGAGDLEWADGVDIENLPNIAIGETLELVATYVVTQEDVLAGEVENCADMSLAIEGEDSLEKTSCAIDPIPQTPALTLVKTSTEATGDDDVLDVGEVITYTFTVTNTGETVLTGVTISDPMVNLIWGDSGNTIPTLGVNESVELTATYVVTQDDIDNGGVENCADAMGMNPDESEVSSGESCDTVDIVPTPGLTVIKTGTTSTGQNEGLVVDDVITYTFLVENTGNVTLTAVTIVDPMQGLIWGDDGNVIDTLAPGASVERTATYTVDQDDIQFGLITNCAEMTSEAPDGTAVSSEQSCDTKGVQQTLELAMVQECPGTLQPFDPQVDQQAEFQVTITNNGNLTVTNVVVSASRDGVFNEPFSTTFEPGQSETRTWSIVMTEEDIESRMVHAEFTVVGDTEGGLATLTASMAAMQSTVGTVSGTLILDCPMVPSLQPEPTVTPVPTTTPEPTPAAPAAPSAPVSQLPDTGYGVATTASMLWAAAIMSAFALGAGAIGLRKYANR